MAQVVGYFFPAINSQRFICFLLFISVAETQNIVVFQPPFITATGPTVSSLLLGNTSDVSLSLRTVYPSNTTGSLGPPSCEAEETQWVITQEQVGKAAVRVKLRLNRSLRLCGENETNSDSDSNCCRRRLCVLQTLQLTACSSHRPQASLLVQVQIHALLFPDNSASDNKTVIPNQVHQPLGSCPCDLTPRTCDVRCCCDQDCSAEVLQLFASHCFPGPFGGHDPPDPDYQCSTQTPGNPDPDWFPFLCVTSPPENNPYLGLFYQGDTIVPKPAPSFQNPGLSAPTPATTYTQGSPVFTLKDQYFTIPQEAVGRCVNNAPVAFLTDFLFTCVSVVQSCPVQSPLLTIPTDLRVRVKNGQGGDVTVELTDEVAVDLSPFIYSSYTDVSSGVEQQVCVNVTLALDYKFYWKQNGITSIKVTRTVGTVPLNGSTAVTTRYSAVFLNGEFTAEPNSGNPGYQVGRPVIGGIVDNRENTTGSIQRTSISVWKAVSDGLCSTAEKRLVLYGENSTSGCLLPVNKQNLTRCDLLRETVSSLQEDLIKAVYVAKTGNPDALNIDDWVNIEFVRMNSSTMNETSSGGSCREIPSHLHVHVWSLITGLIDGKPQRNILSLQVSFSPSTWTLQCGGGDVSPCLDPAETQLFPVSSSVTFTDVPVNTGPPKTRFQINFTEYDCNRNDVCWPELAFPVTQYYTGEPYSQSLAKGLILVFFFIAASVLGTPWRQIRQAWNIGCL